MDNEQEIKELVIERLKTLPEGKDISIGSIGEYTKEQLIQHVESEDELGRKIVEVEMSFLRAFKEGIFYDPNYIAGDAA